jgi:hypothetical protein
MRPFLAFHLTICYTCSMAYTEMQKHEWQAVSGCCWCPCVASHCSVYQNLTCFAIRCYYLKYSILFESHDTSCSNPDAHS